MTIQCRFFAGASDGSYEFEALDAIPGKRAIECEFAVGLVWPSGAGWSASDRLGENIVHAKTRKAAATAAALSIWGRSE